MKSVLEKVQTSIKCIDNFNFLENTHKCNGLFIGKNLLQSGLGLQCNGQFPENTEGVFSVFNQDYCVTSDGWIYCKNNQKFSKFYYGISRPVLKVVELNFGAYPSFAICTKESITIIGSINARLNGSLGAVEFFNGKLFKGHNNFIKIGGELDCFFTNNQNVCQINLDPAFKEVVAINKSIYGLYVFQKHAVWLLTEDSVNGFSLKKIAVFSEEILAQSVSGDKEVYFVKGNEIYFAKGENVKKVELNANFNLAFKGVMYKDYYVVLTNRQNNYLAHFYNTVNGKYTTFLDIIDITSNGLALLNNGQMGLVNINGQGDWYSKNLDQTIDDRKIICGFEFYSYSSGEFVVVNCNKEKVYTIKKGLNKIETELSACQTKFGFKNCQQDFSLKDFKIFYRD